MVGHIVLDRDDILSHYGFLNTTNKSHAGTSYAMRDWKVYLGLTCIVIAEAAAILWVAPILVPG